MAGALTIGRSAHAAGDDLLKVGLVGCGGRHTLDSRAEQVPMDRCFLGQTVDGIDIDHAQRGYIHVERLRGINHACRA